MAALVDFGLDCVLPTSEGSGHFHNILYPWVVRSAAKALRWQRLWGELAFAFSGAFHWCSGVAVDGDIPVSIRQLLQAEFGVNRAGKVIQLDDEGEHFQAVGFRMG